MRAEVEHAIIKLVVELLLLADFLIFVPVSVLGEMEGVPAVALLVLEAKALHFGEELEILAVSMRYLKITR